MTSSTITADATSADHVDILERARLQNDFFQLHAEENEALGRLVPEVFEVLRDLGVPNLFVPKSLGGLELTATQSTRVIEQIAYSDASTGWVAFVTASATGMAGGYLSDEATSRIFDVPTPLVLAGAGAPTGKAVKTDGGYLLTGRWSYGSGTQHADLIHSGAILFEDGRPVTGPDGSPQIMILHAERKDVTSVGNWDTLGLRASGSVDYESTDAFVPDDLVFALADARPHRRDDFYRMGVINLNAIGHAAWAAGVGRRLLDELAAFAESKAGKPGSLADSPSFWEKFGAAEAQYRSARALLYEVWDATDSRLVSGEPFLRSDTTSIRLALYAITEAMRQCADLAYRSAGGTSLRRSTLQRLFRDAYSGTQHVTVSPGVLAAAGRDAAHLSGDKVWGLYDLVDPV